MFRTATNVVAPRWRHFIPKADSMNVQIPYYETSRDDSGVVSVSQKFKLTYVATARVVGDHTVYDLPAGVTANSAESITISYNDVVQNNGSVIVGYIQQGASSEPVYGPKTFEYDAIGKRIVYQYGSGGSPNGAPLPGVNVTIDIVNELDSDNLFVRIPMLKEWMIQGANPIDETLVNADGTGSNQFQGGYRCTLKLISQAAHGFVRISDDKFAFEYRPDMGYYGVDSFAFRLVNALGQESPAYCIRLDVGTNKLPTEVTEDV